MSGDSNSTQIRCQVAILMPAAGMVLTCASPVGRFLPYVLIGRHDRPCEKIQRLFREQWRLAIHLADVIWEETAEDQALWIAEPLEAYSPSDFAATPIDELSENSKQCHTKTRLRTWIENDFSLKPTSRIGWVEKAAQWIEEVTGDRLLPANTVVQYNGGGGFNLLRWKALSGRSYWLKSVAEPNEHEFAVTSFICDLAPTVSPLLLAAHSDWNAWLMLEDEVCRGGARPSLRAAVEALVHVQGRSLLQVQSLLDRGAFDQRGDRFEQDLPILFDYLEESMQMQESTKVPRLSRSELDAIRSCLLQTYRDSTESLPVSILHGDLTGGNVSGNGDQCRFLDWCESYIGVAPISLHHLLMLYSCEGATKADVNTTIQLYRELWNTEFGIQIDASALAYAPLLAAASALYSRGTWLHCPEERNRQQRRSYSRTLARHMAREADLLRERGELCRC